jgi:hypothetical protein
MTTITLNFYQRFHLENSLGGFPIPNVRAAATFLRLLEKIRLGEADRKGAGFKVEGTSASWRLPSPDWAEKTIELEDTEAQALAQAIESFQDIRLADAEWLVPLLDRLTEEEKPQQAAAKAEAA